MFTPNSFRSSNSLSGLLTNKHNFYDDNKFIFEKNEEDDEDYTDIPMTQPDYFSSEEEEPVKPPVRKIKKEGPVTTIEEVLKFFQTPGTYIISGPTGCGKTMLTKKICEGLNEELNLLGVYLFSTSAELEDGYEWLPREMIFKSENNINGALTNFFKKRKNEQILARKNSKNARPAVVIIDDPTGVFSNLSVTSGSKVSPITQWSTKLRKTNTIMILQCQRWNTYSTVVRNNAKTTAVFQPGEEELKVFHKQFNLNTPFNTFRYNASNHFTTKYSFMLGSQEAIDGKRVWLCPPIEI